MSGGEPDMPRFSEMTPDDLRAYERELVRLLREYLPATPSERMPYVVGIELSGRYPETQAVVRYCEPRQGQLRIVEFEIYPCDAMTGERDDWFDPPGVLAQEITNNWEAGEAYRSSRPA
jgi:hypothetical protein